MRVEVVVLVGDRLSCGAEGGVWYGSEGEGGKRC